MPIYEFRCSCCGHLTEDSQYADEINLKCKVCDFPRIHKRQMSKTNFVLKGSGWDRQTYNPENS